MPNVQASSIHKESRVLGQDPASAIPEAYEGIVSNDQYLQVKQTVADNSQRFRDLLRARTGLNASFAKAGLALSLSNDIPDPIADLIRQITHPVLRLKRLQPAMLTVLDESRRLGQFLFHDIREARVILELKDEDERTFFDYIEKLQNIIESLDRLRLQEQLKEIDLDCFGAYFPASQRASIYWIPIAIFAESIGVPIEHLTKVVLIHELAHGYTHVGRDINRKYWRTKAFIESEKKLTEGLAQYYTAVITKELRTFNEKPTVYEAYERLLGCQPENYQGHLAWLKMDLNLVGEAIRFAILEARQRDVPFCYDDFTDLVVGNINRLK